MLLVTLLIAIVLLVINYIPVWFLVSANRYHFFQSIIFGILFLSIWGYKIQTEIELQESKIMDLKESVFRSTHRSKARMRRRYHDPWEYIYIDMKRLENEMEDKREKSAWFLRILSIDSLLVILLAIKGLKKHYNHSEYYRKCIKTYSILFLFSAVVEFINYTYLDL